MKFIFKFCALIWAIAALCDLSMVMEHGRILYIFGVFLYIFLAYISMKAHAICEQYEEKKRKKW